MRILHLTSFLHGAPGLALTELAIAQRRAGHGVTVLTSRSPWGDRANLPGLAERLIAAGVPLHALDTLAVRQTGPNADVVQFLHERLGTAAAFDVLHTHGTIPSVIAIAAARKVTARVPILQTTHEWRVGHSGSRSYDLEVMNLVDRAVVPTWAVADHYAHRGVVRRQIAVVPYGVAQQPPALEHDALAAQMAAWRRDGGVVLCYVSAPDSRQDRRLLMNALPHLMPEPRVLCVHFDGTASDAAPAALPPSGGAALVAARSGVPVRHYLQETDLLVLPSGDGDQPLAVLEAFCDQVPVVASRVPELSEFVEDGQTGWLFDPVDPKALAATIRVAQQTAPHLLRALCQRARVLYQTEFTIDRMVSGYMREYARLT